MAGVKTQKKDGGKRVETRFAAVDCTTCGKVIEKLADAYNVLVIDGKRRTYQWRHRKCLNLAAK